MSLYLIGMSESINFLAKLGLVLVPILVGGHLLWEFTSQSLDSASAEILLFSSDTLRNKKHKINPRLLFGNKTFLAPHTPNQNTVIHDLNSFASKNLFASTLSRTVLNDIRSSVPSPEVDQENFEVHENSKETPEIHGALPVADSLSSDIKK